ncbi:hypothetical protein Taro_045045, partial [Colocasia esculenta]|nr:hypothetical protein [Colocasia esculenta]
HVDSSSVVEVLHVDEAEAKASAAMVVPMYTAHAQASAAAADEGAWNEGVSMQTFQKIRRIQIPSHSPRHISTSTLDEEASTPARSTLMSVSRAVPLMGIQDSNKDESQHDIEGKPLLDVPKHNMTSFGDRGAERSQWKTKSIVTSALTVLTSSQAILIVWSKRAGKYEYSVTTANFLAIDARLRLSNVHCPLLLFGESGELKVSQITTSKQSRSGVMIFASLDEISVCTIPAALYLVKNLLQYYIFAYVDAPSYQILKNFNIISTGVLYRIILKRKLSEIQWAAFILLCAGCTTAQLNSSFEQEFYTCLQLLMWCSSDHVLQTPIQGWMMAIVMALLSGFAGVYTEDFDAVMNKGFFHGYSLITTLMILNHALSGIAVSFVMKYADNIVKVRQFVSFDIGWKLCMQVYSTSVAMLLTAVVSVFLFGFHLSLAFFLGSTVVSVAVYLHSIGKLRR